MHERYGDPLPAERRRAHGDGARRHRQDGLQRLLPDRLGLRRTGPRPTASPSARAVARRRARSSPTRCRSPTSTRSRYDLLFERFLNAERVSMPDIDIDFSVRGRERVIRYVTEKYGTDRVAQIITFGKMFPRAATRDAARVLGHDYGAGDKLAKLIPDPIMGRSPSFEDCLKPGEDLANEVARDPIAKQIVDVAQGLEGIVRNASIHAAAVVISDRNADRHRPAAAGRRRHGRGRREGLPDGHAVLDEADRGDRPAQDGLPGPAQPRRDRGRAGHHRALDGHAAGHGDAAARRPEDLRDDGPGRLGRRVPV